MFDADEDPLRGFIPSPGSRLAASYFYSTSSSLSASRSPSRAATAKAYSPSPAAAAAVAATSSLNSAASGSRRATSPARHFLDDRSELESSSVSPRPPFSSAAAAQKLFASPFRSETRSQQQRQQQEQFSSPTAVAAETIDHDADEAIAGRRSPSLDMTIPPKESDVRENHDDDGGRDDDAQSLLSKIARLSRLALQQVVAANATVSSDLLQRQQQHDESLQDPRDESVDLESQVKAQIDQLIAAAASVGHADVGGVASARLRSALSAAPPIVVADLHQQLVSSVNSTDADRQQNLCSLLHHELQLLAAESQHRAAAMQLKIGAASTAHASRAAASYRAQQRMDVVAAAARRSVQSMAKAVCDAQSAVAALEEAKAELVLAEQVARETAAQLVKHKQELEREMTRQSARSSVVNALLCVAKSSDGSDSRRQLQSAVAVRHGANVSEIVASLRRPVLQSALWAAALSSLGVETAADLVVLRSSPAEWAACLTDAPLLKALLRALEVEF